jgi:hypothetical protein
MTGMDAAIASTATHDLNDGVMTASAVLLDRDELAARLGVSERHSRVNSSMTLSILIVRPSARVSNWKSSAHSTFGRIGHIAPTCTPTPDRRFLRRLYGTRSPSSRHNRRTRLSFT